MFSDGDRAAFLLATGGRQRTLRLGFVLQGTGDILFPETLLDDWGHEIGGVELYSWVRANAWQFPRAELFGLDPNGRPQQYFLRELDLTAGYVCWVSENSSASGLRDGVRLTEILVPDAAAGHRKRNKAPARIPFPLREADVDWWTVDRAITQKPGYDFYRRLEADENR